MLGINWAHDLGLRFGRDLVFTYGPWGWLTAPIALDATTVLVSGVFATVAVVTLWCSVAGRPGGGRTWTWVVLATVVAPAVFALTGASWTLVVGVFTLVLGKLFSVAAPSTRLVALVAASAALLLMVKFPDGVLLCGLTGLLVLWAFSWRALLVATSSFVVTFVALWEMSGGRLVDIPAWLHESLGLTAGYPDAMYLGSLRSPVLVAAGTLVVVGVWSIQIQARGRSRAGLLAVLAVLALLAYALKEGFTRQDTDHILVFFAALLVVGLLPSPDRAQRLARGLVLAAALGGLLIYSNLPGPHLPQQGWADTVHFLSGPDARDRVLADARSRMRDQYAVPDDLVTLVGHRPVAIDPFEAGVAWAYGLDWRPVPVLQPYSAYTPALDRRNARALLTSPRRAVLREEAVVDDRYQLWDTPVYNLTMVCNFRQAGRDSRWTLLVRQADRCAGPHQGRARRVSAGDAVRVPQGAPGDIVTMSFTPDRRSAGRTLAAALLKDPHPLRVRLDATSTRLPRRLAAGPLIVRLPAAVTWPSSAGRPSGGTVAFNTSGSVVFSFLKVR